MIGCTKTFRPDPRTAVVLSRSIRHLALHGAVLQATASRTLFFLQNVRRLTQEYIPTRARHAGKVRAWFYYLV